MATAARARRSTLATGLGLLVPLLVVVPPQSADAVPPATGDVIDDFEDGDASDWSFFGGNAAGGGGGVLGDRPAEGAFYFSTGWGGQGTASGFYGGAFRNLDNAAQVPPPVDPWFNVWVLNQSDTTVDSYTLEITLREDLDGNGWTNGSEDSFRTTTPFAAADFNDEWTLVSAPLGGFEDLSTGGDGTFDGDLDEIVLVIADVVGADPSVIEVDFDHFAFSSGGPLVLDQVVFDDMEHGDPFGNGWFAFNGSVGGGGIGPNVVDLPPANGGSASLETGWGSGGTPGFYGGFGRTFPSDLSGTDTFNFWINPTAAEDYTLEINLQEDDNADGAINAGDDDEFQFDCVIGSTGPCATAGGGWQLVSIPLDDFFRDTSFLSGGNGILDPTTPGRGGNGELINVVVAVIGNTGSDVNFVTDYWAFTRGPLIGDSRMVVEDFESGVAPGTPCPANAPPLGFCTFNGAGSTVSIDTSATPPAPVLPAVGTPNQVLQLDVDATSFAGFINGFDDGGTWGSRDWSRKEGLSFWFSGAGSGTSLFVDVLDNRTAGSTTDDAERFTVSFTDDVAGWQLLEFPFSSFSRKEIGNGAPNDGFGLVAIHGWALGTLDTGGPRTFHVDQVSTYGVAAPPALAVQLTRQNTLVDEGDTAQVGVRLNRPIGPDDPATVSIDFATERADAVAVEEFTPTSGTLTFTDGGAQEQFFPVETFDDTKFEGDEQIVVRLTNPVDVERGTSFQGSVRIEDNDPFDPLLLDDFERGAWQWDTAGPVTLSAERSESGDANARPGQDAFENVLLAQVPAGPSDAAFSRDFPQAQDWTSAQSLDFWFEGSGSGDDVVVTLKDNRAPDPGPAGWEMVWADEFNEPIGSPPNPANWTHELGDTTPDGKNGWGNEELQYYTDDNAATDGAGNLVISLDEADGSQECYYGPCAFESARLLTQHKQEFAYGRIESRLRVPDGGDGLWPAFWSLGTDITHNPWPGAGEIDFMEYVSRLPEEIFGTIHGPGYNGGGSFGGITDFGVPVSDEFHTFTVEWEPELITWYVDGTQYHQATPADVAPNPWVFEKPFFLLLNFAIGGNFGGEPDPGNTYPQEYLVDYVRVSQAPDTAERFETTFTDDVAGWQRVSIPTGAFVRSTDQPAGAPNDGLGLDEVWGYGFALPSGDADGEVRVDLVELVPVPAPTEVIVTTLADAGAGSLREALDLVADDGTIIFDPDLAGGTITLTSGQLLADRSVTVDASAVPGLVVSGGNASRVLEVAAGAEVDISDLVIADGVGAPQGGGVLNNGTLTLERVVVRDNTESSVADGPAFDLGGGGIYNGQGAMLDLVDSTVADNATVTHPAGGIHGFFDSTITITRSTVSGNVGADVAGGLRSLGDVTIVDSTFSGNTSTAWHGGAIFHTDGTLTVTSSTFAENNAPAGTASGILVATFGPPASATLTNNVLEGHDGAFACATEGGGAATITSGGNNVISDGSCNPDGTTDQSSTDALLEPLSDNGGPTLTHALGDGSPAIDAAADGACSATDQRGVVRPQGDGCDVGAYEVEVAVEPVYCDGLLATMVGGPGPDELIGGPGRDVIAGQGGDDKLVGLGGDDVICGGDGDDEIIGNHGNDRLFGGGDDDTIYAGPGDDLVKGEAGSDRLFGFGGADELFGGTQDDAVFGGVGADLLLGGSGDDELSGGNQNDKIIGGPGDDEIAGGNGNDDLFGTGGNDWLRGDNGRDFLFGSGGDDRLDGGNGVDRAVGGAGTDTCAAESTAGCE